MLERYRIEERLGAGGMGVVYRAVDATLGRTVALKFLTAKALTGGEFHARFLREARTAASLNHPGICTVYEVGEISAADAPVAGPDGPLAAGTPVLAMEFVPGRTLADELQGGRPLPLPRLLDVALQVAEALAFAHGRSVVHRDLKPGNVIVTPEGRIKLLDFGLAKSLEPGTASDPHDVQASTISAALTQAGVVLGTVAYMSPEQARGEAVGQQSDVFSFGVMLYELATGTRPFRGTTMMATLAKIIESAPDPALDALETLPWGLRRAIARCLEKRPDDRFNDTRDLAAELRALQRELVTGQVTATAARAPSAAIPAPPRARRAGLVAGAVVVALAALAAGAWYLRGGTGPPRAATPPTSMRQVTDSGLAGDQAALSPDGQFALFVEHRNEKDVLLIRDLAGGRPIELYALEGLIQRPRWSPDGTSVSFFARVNDRAQNASYALPRLGGTPRRLGPWWTVWGPERGRYLSWHQGDRIQFHDGSGAVEREIPLPPDAKWLWGLEWAPRSVVLAWGERQNGRAMLWARPENGEWRPLLDDEGSLVCAEWSAGDPAVYFVRKDRNGTNLWKLPLTPALDRPVGTPRLLIPGFDASSISISNDSRRLLYVKTSPRSSLHLATWDAAARTARFELLTPGTAFSEEPAFSPDGQSLVFTRVTDGKPRVWLMSLADRTPRQFAFGDASESAPAWSPDGSRIAFIETAKDGARVVIMPAGGGDPVTIPGLLPGEDLGWLPDGALLVQAFGNRDFVRVEPGRPPGKGLVRDPRVGWIFAPKPSPDGRRIAVFWNQRVGGMWLIDTATHAETLLLEGGDAPLGWSPDGKFVFALRSGVNGRGGSVVRVDVASGAAQKLFDVPFAVSEGQGDMARDARHFVFAADETESDLWVVDSFDR